LPFSIGPPEKPIDGRSHDQQRRRRLVAAHHQHDAVERVRADRFLHVHRDLVAKEHRRRPHHGLAEAHHGELERKPAGLEHARLDVLSQLAEVRVARRHLRPGVADADHRLADEKVVREALVLHPRAVDEVVALATVEPGLRAQLVLGFGTRIVGHGNRSVECEGGDRSTVRHITAPRYQGMNSLCP
jgi:hypothetical protein